MNLPTPGPRLAELRLHRARARARAQVWKLCIPPAARRPRWQVPIRMNLFTNDVGNSISTFSASITQSFSPICSLAILEPDNSVVRKLFAEYQQKQTKHLRLSYVLIFLYRFALNALPSSGHRHKLSPTMAGCSRMFITAVFATVRGW